MENTGYVALSYAVGLERKMDIVANNIANVDTNGYKANHMIFNEYIVNNRNQKPLSMVEDYGNYRNQEPGVVQQTGNPLDVALMGNGFLSVNTAGGEKYTRNGAMHTDAKGQLVTASGDQVNDEGGKPIVIPPEARSITIANDGTISTQDGPIGRLKVVKFEKPRELEPVGNNLYTTKQTGTPDITTKVTQGAVEGSNVNAVVEMTDMIEVMRKYESVARILQNEHDSQTSMIQRLSKI